MVRIQQKAMESPRLYGWVALALVAAFAMVACSQGESVEEKPVIRLHDGQGESMLLNNAIAKLVIEEGYSYPVESVVQSTPAMQKGLPTGETDINLEGWQQNIIDWYDQEIGKETILNLGVIYEDSSQVFVIPKWVTEEYGIKDVFDLAEHWQVFTDPQDPAKGAFYNCIAGWHCAKINRAKLDAYGLSAFYNAVSPASAAALVSVLTDAQVARRPVLGYYWAPSPLMVSYDWYVLEEPPYSDECWKEVSRAAEDEGGPLKQACAYEAISIDKLAHAGLEQKAPDVLVMLRKMIVGLGPLNATLSWAIKNTDGDWEKAAIHYLRTYEDGWRTWVTPGAFEKITAALEKAP